MITAKALQYLGFESQVDFRLYDNIDGSGPQMEWLSSQPQPSESEIATGQAGYDAEAYKRNRADEYPPIGDQLDSLFHAGVFPADMAAQLQAVKDKYPNG